MFQLNNTVSDVKMVRHFKQKNTTPFKQFDCSVVNNNDVVLLIDGDWLAFSSCSKEMERFITVTIDGEDKEFAGLTEYKKYLQQIDQLELYKTHNIVNGQRNHDKAVVFAKHSCKAKIAEAIKKTDATKVILFLGNTGNFRDQIPLPQLKNYECSTYKGQRSGGYRPDTLEEVKEWLLTNWDSHWAVGQEADDCIVITKNELYNRGNKVYIAGVDKDFLNETTGGLLIVGHHEKPVYKTGTNEDVLGEFYTKGKGSYNKPCGGGDKFLAHQLLHGDDTDLYLPTKFMQEFGTLGKLGIKGVEKYINQFNTRKDLWQGVYDFYNEYLPIKMDYLDCFGVTHKDKSPLYFLNLYYQCALMQQYADHKADIRVLFDELGINYD